MSDTETICNARGCEDPATERIGCPSAGMFDVCEDHVETFEKIGVVAYEFEVVNNRGEERDIHTTIQRTHPSETFAEVSGIEYRNVRELVYRD